MAKVEVPIEIVAQARQTQDGWVPVIVTMVNGVEARVAELAEPGPDPEAAYRHASEVLRAGVRGGRNAVGAPWLRSGHWC